MKPRVLVLTTVHWPDDTRIRQRLIGTLSSAFEVVYAAKTPGPSDVTGLDYVGLEGGRLTRNLRAIRLALSGRWDILVIHDPELVACAILARLFRRRPVVFDVHEDVPASAYTRSWVPKPARHPLAVLMRGVLRLAEGLLSITLAEHGYQRLFSKPHPVFANYPNTTGYPEADADHEAPVVYVGDVTIERGADLAVAACSDLGVALRLVGRVRSEAERRLRSQSTLGDDLRLEGLVPNPDALQLIAGSSVGLAPLRDLPNYRDSQPTKILEYLAVGIPVVASDLPGTRELVAGLDAVFLFEPGKADALAEAIAEARTSDVYRRAKEQSASIRTRFRWPSEDVVQFYLSLL